VNGAESLLAAMTRNGIDVCFANPGTSELHFVAALDRAGGMRCVLGLFEGVLTGAADGYARMADRPASTLLHLGPGLANGLSNLHNAMRAQGGFNRSSQHLDHGGVRWDAVGSNCRTRRRVHVGSGRRIGRCGRRCGHRAGLSPRVRCSGSSGG
jgi:hypothetical protein